MNLAIAEKLNGFIWNHMAWQGFVFFFAHYLPYILIAMFAVILFFDREKSFARRSKIFLTAVASGVFALIVKAIISHFYSYNRPFIEKEIIKPILQMRASEYYHSFPSGHTIFFFAFSFIVYKYNRKFGLIFFGLSLCVAVARIFAGVHYPIDIFGGIILGILCGWIVERIARKIGTKA